MNLINKTISAFLILTVTTPVFANQFKYVAKSSALLTNVEINCSRNGQAYISNLVQLIMSDMREFNKVSEQKVDVNQVSKQYSSIFSCERALSKALSFGFSEQELRTAIANYDLKAEKSNAKRTELK